jgi:hypothetical protein
MADNRFGDCSELLRTCLGHLIRRTICPGVVAAQESEASKGPCIEPPPMIKWEDYRGPLQKVVGPFAARLERRSAHAPRYKPVTVLCSLEVKDKFILFVQDTFDPISFLSAGFNAGTDHAANQDSTFGQGASGYVKRFAAAFADQTSSRFFKDFAYPTVFSEDPRYYRLGHGNTEHRLVHVAQHTFVAHHDSGRHMFNFSEWLGSASAVALSDAYHPGNQHGVGPAARQGGFTILGDMGSDVLREFWPDIARKLRMPFRGMQE